MEHRGQINNILNKIIEVYWFNKNIDDEIISNYQRLNEKCDKIISKIKARKEKNK